MYLVLKNILWKDICLLIYFQLLFLVNCFTYVRIYNDRYIGFNNNKVYIVNE